MIDLSELIQFIFSLGDQADPIGKSIIQLIYSFFWIGVVVYVVHFVRLFGEYIILRHFQNYIKINYGLGDISVDLLDRLRSAKVFPISIIYRRIRDLVQIIVNFRVNDTCLSLHLVVYRHCMYAVV